MKKILIGAVIVIVLIVISGVLFIRFVALKRGSYTYDSAYAIESRYANRGMNSVKTLVVYADRGEERYVIYYPSDLIGPYPVITWGNGSEAQPGTYAGLFDHLASWGFVVIDTYCRATGTGQEMLQAVEYLVDQNNNPESFLFGRLQTDRIGSAGTSQGSTGAINAHTKYENGTLIKTVVSNALPGLRWCDPEDVYDVTQINVPFFIMSGTRDIIVSPAEENVASIQSVEAGVPALMAMSVGAGHLEIEKDGGSYRGYLTAWMAYHLQDDSVAATAFTGAVPEIKTNEHWESVLRRELGN